MDDSSLSRRDEDERLSSKYNQGTFTTGRTRSAKKPHDTVFSQRSQESVLPPPPAPAGPGKLNLADYHQVSSALSRLSLKAGHTAPLADGETGDIGGEGGDYAVPQDVINNGLVGSEYAQPTLAGSEQGHTGAGHRPKPRSKNRERRERAKIEYSDSETDSSSDERDRPQKKPGASRKTRKKRSAIPVATPVVPNIPNNMVKLPEAGPHPLEKRKYNPCASDVLMPITLKRSAFNPIGKLFFIHPFVKRAKLLFWNIISCINGISFKPSMQSLVKLKHELLYLQSCFVKFRL